MTERERGLCDAIMIVAARKERWLSILATSHRGRFKAGESEALIHADECDLILGRLHAALRDCESIAERYCRHETGDRP